MLLGGGFSLRSGCCGMCGVAELLGSWLKVLHLVLIVGVGVGVGKYCKCGNEKE